MTALLRKLRITPGRRDQRGFTLIELMVSVAIMGSLGGVITASSFAMLTAQTDTNSNAQVAIAINISSRWLIRDIHRAASSNLIDGAAAVNSATFNWIDGGSAVACTYSANATDNTLERSCGGVVSKVGDGVSGLQFTRSIDLVTVSYSVTSEMDASRTENVVLHIVQGGG